jgi:hypothetical protein
MMRPSEDKVDAGRFRGRELSGDTSDNLVIPAEAGIQGDKL